MYVFCVHVYVEKEHEDVYMHLSRIQLAKLIGSMYYIEYNCRYVPISVPNISSYKREPSTKVFTLPHYFQI